MAPSAADRVGKASGCEHFRDELSAGDVGHGDVEQQVASGSRVGRTEGECWQEGHKSEAAGLCLEAPAAEEVPPRRPHRFLAVQLGRKLRAARGILKRLQVQ